MALTLTICDSWASFFVSHDHSIMIRLFPCDDALHKLGSLHAS